MLYFCFRESSIYDARLRLWPKSNLLTPAPQASSVAPALAQAPSSAPAPQASSVASALAEAPSLIPALATVLALASLAPLQKT